MLTPLTLHDRVILGRCLWRWFDVGASAARIRSLHIHIETGCLPVGVFPRGIRAWVILPRCRLFWLLSLILCEDALSHARKSVLPGTRPPGRPRSRLRDGHGIVHQNLLCVVWLSRRWRISSHRVAQPPLELTRARILQHVVRQIQFGLFWCFKHFVLMLLLIYRCVLILRLKWNLTAHHTLSKLLEAPSVARSAHSA